MNTPQTDSLEASLADPGLTFEARVALVVHFARQMELHHRAAAVLVAMMHKAATGDDDGPLTGVVEDVAAMRLRMVIAEGRVKELEAQRSQFIQTDNNLRRGMTLLDREVIDLRKQLEACRMARRLGN